MKSIKRFLIIVLLSIICLANFSAALQGYRKGLFDADRLVEKQLNDSIALIRALLPVPGSLAVELYPPTQFFQVLRADEIIYRSAHAQDPVKVANTPGIHLVSYRQRNWYVLTQQDLVTGYTLVVGQRVDAYRGLIEDIIIEAILPIIWILPALVFIIGLIVSLGFKPVTRFAALLEKRKAEDLTPIAVESFPEELAVVVASANQLFDRLDRVYEREKRFAADAAHELRTPLAALKVNLHNLARDLGDDHPIIQELVASTTRMGHSIEQILTLSRLSPEKLLAKQTRVEMKTLAQNVIAELYVMLDNKEQNITLEAEAIDLQADEFSMKTLIRNLLDNAIKYTPSKGDILITIQRQLDTLQLSVEDSGPGVPSSDYARILDRFYRSGGDCHDSGVTGSGLGLSIVDLIVRMHHGDINVSASDQLGGLRVQITLPLRHL